MTPLGEILAGKIEREGPIPFWQFMSAALYDREHGYYRRARDPFGKHGDFYTAEQLQPVFGILVAQRIRQLAHSMGDPEDFTVVELGAGRGEMASAFQEWRYIPIDLNGGELPRNFRGVVFCNEFFDALPVRALQYQDGAFREQLVTYKEGAFQWISGAVVEPCETHYLRRFYPPPEEGRWYEVPMLDLWMARIGRSLDDGWLLTIDYGYTREESVRFPRGTLMSYRRHIALDDVLADPGDRDITAHVNFTAMMELGEACGLVTERFETLAAMLLTSGEPDQFAAALGRGADEAHRRAQLKTLLFGMGETFRVLLQRRDLNRTAVPEN
jgi:SAM-dependent MidA family methyltransferase